MTPVDWLANLFSTPGGRVLRTADDRGTLDDRAMALAHRPAQSTLGIVASATLVFFQAERGHNPRVHTLFDALGYVSACLQVGLSPVVPVTPAGKLVGAALMTVGPSLSAAFTAGPVGRKAADAVDREALETLKMILARLPEPAPPEGDGPATRASDERA